ncbi:MAG: hypothetical protein DMF06_00395 [Verrucomicrobia bacterium]|nr:MAG: hypothetical protein DMF06_00395 [Verrucomicrobiota bacterium]
MDSKIFLGKYRVAAEKLQAVGEIADSPLAYQAEEIDSGKKVVVNVVPTAGLKAGVRERLEAEAISARKLNHVNIPALDDFGVEDDHLIYVWEDFEGTPAEEWVNVHGPMPVGAVLRIASQVVSSLAAAAVYGINHYAINPSNLVLVPGQTPEGEWPLVKVLHSVGVAPKLAGTDIAVAAFDKSLHYASPEQLQQGKVDFRSELYSLGATMWFLLTSAPPLVAPAGSTAAPPATSGVAAEKIAALPKKIRRLLTQMLAVNPEARPGDFLAFDRTLQDCLNQVERRETMSRRFGIPPFSTNSVTGRRRVPVKALALAALLLALVAVAGLVASKYLRHERIVRAEEPIGKPIGVPEASVSATPANTTAANAIVAQVSPPTVAALNSNTQSGPIKDAEADKVKPLPTPAESRESAATADLAVVPVPPPAASDSPKSLPSPEPATVIANNAAVLPTVTDSSTKQPEPTPVKSPDAEAGAIAQQTAPKTSTMHEVRRAEPPPPDEGPKSDAARKTTSDAEPKITEKSAAKKTEPTAKPKKQVERKDNQRSERHSESPEGPRGARFLGLTPEGWHILELPSGNIIVVPPRRSSP